MTSMHRPGIGESYLACGHLSTGGHVFTRFPDGVTMPGHDGRVHWVALCTECAAAGIATAKLRLKSLHRWDGRGVPTGVP